MLQHTLLKEAAQLDGMYKQALNRIYNQVTAAPDHTSCHCSPFQSSRFLLSGCAGHHMPLARFPHLKMPPNPPLKSLVCYG